MRINEQHLVGDDLPKERPRLTAEVIRERLARGATNAAALDEQLDEVFVLREASAALKLTIR